MVWIGRTDVRDSWIACWSLTNLFQAVGLGCVGFGGELRCGGPLVTIVVVVVACGRCCVCASTHDSLNWDTVRRYLLCLSLKWRLRWNLYRVPQVTRQMEHCGA